MRQHGDPPCGVRLARKLAGKLPEFTEIDTRYNARLNHIAIACMAPGFVDDDSLRPDAAGDIVGLACPVAKAHFAYCRRHGSAARLLRVEEVGLT